MNQVFEMLPSFITECCSPDSKAFQALCFALVIFSSIQTNNSLIKCLRDSKYNLCSAKWSCPVLLGLIISAHSFISDVFNEFDQYFVEINRSSDCLCQEIRVNYTMVTNGTPNGDGFWI